MGPALKCHFVSGLPSGSLEIPQLGLLRLWVTFYADLWSRWSSKQSCSPRRELSNGMLHATCTWRNQGDLWLLVVGSQIANLTSDPSFGHNLCLKCPNRSCEPILDIYVPRDFQWYKEFLNPLNFDPYKTFSKNLGIHQDSNSQSGSSFGSVRVHSFTSPTLQGACGVTPGLPSWTVTLQALALVMSLRLGLGHHNY
jgi:hypothetical protein